MEIKQSVNVRVYTTQIIIFHFNLLPSKTTLKQTSRIYVSEETILKGCGSLSNGAVFSCIRVDHAHNYEIFLFSA